MSQKIPTWNWIPEKFRNVNMHLQEVDESNPVPLLVKATSLEEMREIATKFNKDFNYEDPKDYGLFINQITSETCGDSVQHTVMITLPWGTYGQLTSTFIKKEKSESPLMDKPEKAQRG